MENNEILEKLQSLTQKEVSLSSLCKSLEMEELEILGFVNQLKEDGINIILKNHDDDIYLYCFLFKWK